MVDPIRRFQAGEMEAVVYPDQDSMGFAAAARAADILIGAVARKGSARVIIATGNSQLSFVRSLPLFEAVPWREITVFHMDEYVGLPQDHPASFRRWIQTRIEKPLQPREVHYLAGDTARPEGECKRYAELLQEAPIDLVCLGIGENGHIAFNDPPVADFKDPEWVKVVELDYLCRKQQVGEGHFANLDAVPTHALTLTISALLAPENIQVVVPESRKAAAVRQAVQGEISTACPASILRTVGKAVLFLDSDAAREVGR